VRRGAGALAPVAGVLRRMGVESFSAREIEVRLREVGFEDVQVHHARALWLVVSARKPGVATGPTR